MPSTISDIIKLSRNTLNDQTFWSDQELARLCLAGIRDLYRASEALNDDYNVRIYESDLRLEAGSKILSGLPDDIYKIRLIEPRDDQVVTTLPFEQRKFDHDDMYVNRIEEARLDLSGVSYPDTIYYGLEWKFTSGTRELVIHVAPTTRGSDLPLRMTYVPNLESLVLSRSPSDQGRDTIVNSNVTTTPTRGTFFLVDVTIPSSGEGQLSFGFSGESGATVSTSFGWSEVRDAESASVGDAASEANGVSFPLAHPGVRAYANRIIDTTNVIVGRTSDNKLLISLDSEQAIATLFPIQPLKVYHLRRLEGLVAKDVDVNAIVPLVGGTDHALMCWTIGHALAKQDERRQPDISWIQLYSTEKQNIINALVDEPSISNVGDASVYYLEGGSIGNSLVNSTTTTS